MAIKDWFRKKKCVCGNPANTKHQLVLVGVDDIGNPKEMKYWLCSYCVEAMEKNGNVIDKDK